MTAQRDKDGFWIIRYQGTGFNPLKRDIGEAIDYVMAYIAEKEEKGKAEFALCLYRNGATIYLA